MFLALCLLANLSPVRPAAAGTDPRTYTLASPIRAASDDMEEWLSSGDLDYRSSDLELGVEHPGEMANGAQIVGLRFAQLKIPQGAAISDAYVQFTAKGVKRPGECFDAVIAVEDADDSAPLNADSAAAPLAPYDLSSRRTADASVRWTLAAEDAGLWTSANKTGEAQQTPDLSALVQEIVDRPGWASGNAMTFLFRGTGNRTAVSYDKNPSQAPVLFVTFAYAGSMAEQDAPAGLEGAAPTREANDDGRILGTTADMEWKPSGADALAWQTCAVPAVAGLAAGEYAVRYAAKADCMPSPATTVVIPSYEAAEYRASHITLQPGADASQMNFAWYVEGLDSRRSVVQVAPRADMTGGDFPVDAARSFSGTVVDDFFHTSNEVCVSGLAPNTAYVYRLGDGMNYGEVYGFSTRNPESYNAIFVSDPQIGCSENVRKDTERWKTTLSKALETFPNSSFIICAGDQVEISGNRAQYVGFFAPVELATVPLVPTVGNHDNGALFSRHFNLPNESSDYGVTAAAGDYWFTYGNTLYMVLNTNAKRVSSHDAFLDEAIRAAGTGIVWKVVVAHHSIYSSGPHATTEEVLLLRKVLYPVFDKHGIDVALMGHDHCYTRSYQMLNGVAQNGLEEYAVRPEGTLYITANSSSGSKYYRFREIDAAYRAVRWQGGETSYSNIEVTDTAFSITTYKTGSNEVIDAYTILKPASAVSGPTGLPPVTLDDGAAGEPK